MSLLSAILDVINMETAPTVLGLSQATSTLSQPQPWVFEALGGWPSASGKHVSPDTAMRTAAVYACVAVLSQSVAQMPLVLMRRTKNGGAEPAEDHPLYPVLLNLSNTEMTAQDSRELAMNHLCLRGNAYFQIVRDMAGRIAELWPLHPDFVLMRRDDYGNLVYDYTPQGGSKSTFQANEVWRIVGMSFNGIQGVSPITFAREAIGLAMATEEHGAKLFANGAQIATAFEHPAKLSKEAYERLKHSLDDRYAGSRNAFKSIILEENMKVSKLSMTSVDSQFIDSRKFQLEEICRIYRVPPHKVQDMSRATFNNIEHLSIDFVQSSLMPWNVRFEQTGYRDLLLPNERKRYFLRTDADSLLRGDAASRANFYASAITNRWMNPNEARRKEGMNPYDGGDSYENPNTTSSAAGDKPGEAVPAPQKG